MRTQRSHVFFGGRLDQRLWDRTVWLLGSVRRALEGFLGMRLFLICGLVVQQVRGIPIGGPLSGAVLHTVLSDLEFQSDKTYPRRRRSVATGRYVDDIILASKVNCSTCLRRMVYHVYGSTVKFDSTDTTHPNLRTVMVPYLEATIFLTLTSANTYVIHKNEAYAFTGNIMSLAKQSITPFLGTFTPKQLQQHRAEL